MPLWRKVYVLATHGIFSGTCSPILQEAGNLEKVQLLLEVNESPGKRTFCWLYDGLISSSRLWWQTPCRKAQMWLEWAPNWRSLTSQVGLLSCVPPFPNWLSLQGMVSEFIRRSHYNESVCRKKSERWKFKRDNDLKVSVLSGRYFKLTDKETEHKERKISDVGVFDPFTLVSSSQRSNSLHNLDSFLRQIWLRQQFASLPSFSWPHFWIEFPDSGHFESWFIEDHLLRIILANSSAEQVSCSGRPSPGHGDGPGGPGGFP